MIQLEQQQHREFVCGGVVADTNYLYPARWGWIKKLYQEMKPPHFFIFQINSISTKYKTKDKQFYIDPAPASWI